MSVFKYMLCLLGSFKVACVKYSRAYVASKQEPYRLANVNSKYHVPSFTLVIIMFLHLPCVLCCM